MSLDSRVRGNDGRRRRNPPLREAKGTRKIEANFAGDSRGGERHATDNVRRLKPRCVIPATATSFPRTREPRVKQSTPLPRKRTGPTKAARGKRLFLCPWIPASAGMTGSGGEILPFAKRRGRERAKRISQGMLAEGMGHSSSKTTYTPHHPRASPARIAALARAPFAKRRGGNLHHHRNNPLPQHPHPSHPSKSFTS